MDCVRYPLFPTDTLEKIKTVNREPTRPLLREDGVHDDIVRLAQCCWHENPVERPGFGNVRRVLKQIRTVRCHNFQMTKF